MTLRDFYLTIDNFKTQMINDINSSTTCSETDKQSMIETLNNSINSFIQSVNSYLQTLEETKLFSTVNSLRAYLQIKSKYQSILTKLNLPDIEISLTKYIKYYTYIVPDILFEITYDQSTNSCVLDTTNMDNLINTILSFNASNELESLISKISSIMNKFSFYMLTKNMNGTPVVPDPVSNINLLFLDQQIQYKIVAADFNIDLSFLNE